MTEGHVSRTPAGPKDYRFIMCSEAAKLNAKIMKLNKLHQAIIGGRYLSHLKNNEIAKELQISVRKYWRELNKIHQELI